MCSGYGFDGFQWIFIDFLKEFKEIYHFRLWAGPQFLYVRLSSFFTAFVDLGQTGRLGRPVFLCAFAVSSFTDLLLYYRPLVPGRPPHPR